MDLGQLVTLFMLLGLLFLAGLHITVQGKIVLVILSVVSFLVAVVLHLVVVTI